MAPISLSDPVLRCYMFYSAVLAMKMLAMSVLTSRVRYQKRAFANEEDTKLWGVQVRSDRDVERVRRAHLNDLENIPVFWVVGALYASTGPGVAGARLLFRAFAAARVLHTAVYAVAPVPQPARALAFAVGYVVTCYMAACVAVHYASAM